MRRWKRRRQLLCYSETLFFTLIPNNKLIFFLFPFFFSTLEQILGAFFFCFCFIRNRFEFRLFFWIWLLFCADKSERKKTKENEICFICVECFDELFKWSDEKGDANISSLFNSNKMKHWWITSTLIHWWIPCNYYLKLWNIAS